MTTLKQDTTPIAATVKMKDAALNALYEIVANGITTLVMCTHASQSSHAWSLLSALSHYLHDRNILAEMQFLAKVEMIHYNPKEVIYSYAIVKGRDPATRIIEDMVRTRDELIHDAIDLVETAGTLEQANLASFVLGLAVVEPEEIAIPLAAAGFFIQKTYDGEQYTPASYSPVLGVNLLPAARKLMTLASML
jgi:hypothetical protein